MQNSSDGDYIIVDTNGEIIDKVRRGEVYTIKTEKQVENGANYLYSITEKINEPFVKLIGANVIRILRKNDGLALPLLILSQRIEPTTNVLLKDGKRYGAVHLAKDLKITRQMAHRYLRKLKELGAVKDVKIRKKNFLVVNPYLFHKGNKVLVATKMAFKEI